MKTREKETLELEENFKNNIERELNEKQTQNRIVVISDIKLVGKAVWQDKISKKPILENVFIVEKKIKDINENGVERETEQKSYYLGDKCIAAQIGEKDLIYDPTFKISEPDKIEAVNNLLKVTTKEEIESRSLNKLRLKEISEVLTAYLNKMVLIEDVEKRLEEINETDREHFKEEKSKRQNRNNLSKKQTEKIKVNGIQKADLSELVDGDETLGKRLDLQEYDSLYVVYSEDVQEITRGIKKNNTTYSLVGMTKEGNAKVLNDEFEIDKTSAISGNKEQTKIRENNTATVDSNDLSVYRRKSNGMSIGCENNKGRVDMFLYQSTISEPNEKVGIQIKTDNINRIPLETRDIMSRDKGKYQQDSIKKEVKGHIQARCQVNDIEDFDGKIETSTHKDIDYRKVDRDDYIPNTYITWGEFIDGCGYNGENSLKKAVEVINNLKEINEDIVKKFIEYKEKEFDDMIEGYRKLQM